MPTRGGVSYVHLEEDVRVALVGADGLPIDSGHPLPVSGTFTADITFPPDYPLPAGQLATLTPNGLTDTQLRASPLALPTNAATAAKQDTMIANLQTLNSLTPATYDYIGLGYTGADLTQVIYKNGGVGGSIISTLTLAYSSSILQSVTKT